MATFLIVVCGICNYRPLDALTTFMIGVTIIIANSELLKKLDLTGEIWKNSLESVKMFFEDAKNAGYRL